MIGELNTDKRHCTSQLPRQLGSVAQMEEHQAPSTLPPSRHRELGHRIDQHAKSRL
jgi:hypothetical protein